VDIRRGDIFLIDLNPVVGTEQSGVRPALIIQIDSANTSSPHTIIIPFTTKIRDAILPSHVKFIAGTGGLVEDSVLLCEQIRVIDKKRLVQKIGNIEENKLTKVTTAVKAILGLG